MNLKAVELQIAIPRTHEAGRVQQEIQQRPLVDQSLLSAESIRHHEQERRKSAHINESAHNKTIKREEHPQNEMQHNESASEQEQEHHEQSKEQPAEHPYKGHHIDLSL